MRVSFIHLLTALGALASLANAYHDDVGAPLPYKVATNAHIQVIYPYPQYTFAARDNLDELTTFDRREILADITTRDLLAELAGRLEARSGDRDPYPQFKCLACGATFAGIKAGQKSEGTCAQQFVAGAMRIGLGIRRDPSRISIDPRVVRCSFPPPTMWTVDDER
ncbi:hypothetical protein DFP72DRAFT_855288 [Ephemerocybe angulata]|uniref:Uncharacterized protein n=1 Tax=Ephemerocybe angulata TaxID=980116 RepID=A0A8H6LYC6_9AGAR|nr:hypothetical protein DFP72DRAFT_855288 [Tulosesus angulatus]